ncbi:MAG: response regulator [Pseudohongiellaceae bacterium]
MLTDIVACSRPSSDVTSPIFRQYRSSTDKQRKKETIELEPLTIIGTSFAAILALNLLATVLIWTEFRSCRFEYIRFVAIGQSFAVVYQAVNLWLTIAPPTDLGLRLSNMTIFLSGLFYLVASMGRSTPPERWIYGAAACYVTILVVDLFVPLPILDWSWYFIFLLFAATPAVTLFCFSARQKSLVTVLQLLVGSSLITGLILLDSNPDLGGVVYLLNAMLVPILTITFVITAVSLSRLELADRERDYRVFFDAVKEVFYRSDQEGCITAVSPSFSQFEIHADAMEGALLSDYLTDPETYLTKLETAKSTMQPFEYSGAMIGGGLKTDCEITCTPILDLSTQRLHFAGVIRNTHERNLLKQQFIDAQRRESLGVLAGGVAHDFNNLMQGIMGHTELLLRPKTTDAGEQKDRLISILKATTTAGNLCRQLLQYTGKSYEDIEEFDLTETIAEVVDILKPSHSQNIETQLQLPDMPVFVRGDKSQIGQVFLNLIKNAMEAVDDDGRILVTLEKREVDRNHITHYRLARDFPPGEYLIVAVRDNGPGIDPAIQPLIFDPFFSTKQGGHGLGLAAISGILQSHKGAISLDSRKGEGAVFSVFMPSLKEHAELNPVPTVGSLPSKLILLVDDDEIIRDVATAILEEAGHRVLVAHDGIHALEIFDASADTIDLLVTDVRMPQMDGITLTRRLKQDHPTLPVIIATGYADISNELNSSESLRFEFIRKPYRSHELLAAVESAFKKMASAA